MLDLTSYLWCCERSKEFQHELHGEGVSCATGPYLQTFAAARKADSKTIKALRNSGFNQSFFMRLANLLEIEPRTRNAASAVFMRVLIGFLMRDFMSLSASLGCRLSLIVVDFPKSAVALGELHDCIFDALDSRIHRALDAAGIKWAFGGFHLSIIEHEENRFQPHYCPQAWIFAPTTEVRGGAHIIRKFFPRGVTKSCPIIIRDWDGSPAMLAKSFRLDNSRQIVLVSGGSRKRELVDAHRAEIALNMYFSGPFSRFFGYNINVKTLSEKAVLCIEDPFF